MDHAPDLHVVLRIRMSVAVSRFALRASVACAGTIYVWLLVSTEQHCGGVLLQGV